mgnify:FL=1
MLNSTLSLDGVLAYLLREAVKIVGAQNGVILVKEGEELKVKTAIPENTEFPYSRTIVTQVFEEQETLCMLDASNESSIDPLSSIKSGNLRSVICAPLLWRGEVQGVIYLDHRVSENLFQEEQKRLIEALSQQWAVALENAALHEEREFLHEIALQKASDELAETQAQLFTAHELTAVVTNSVRRPLNDLTESLKTFKEQAPQLPFDPILDSLAGLQRLVELFRDFVQPDSDQWQVFSLDQILGQALALGLTGDAELVTDLQEARVKGDSASIGRVFLNLLNNSEDAVQHSSRAKKISVKTYTESGRAVLEIEDSGCGMSHDVKARMLEPFFSTKGVGSRSGLGLAVADQALKMHGADVTVESEQGQGTKLTIVFPPL